MSIGSYRVTLELGTPRGKMGGLCMSIGRSGNGAKWSTENANDAAARMWAGVGEGSGGSTGFDDDDDDDKSDGSAG